MLPTLEIVSKLTVRSFKNNPIILRGYLCPQTTIRNYAAKPKRFYEKTSVIDGESGYEIILDRRKLKTPGGKILTIQNELLALGVANEWESQHKTIDRSNMHLTALCSTAIDNPNNLTKEDLASHIVNYLETDTILFFSNNDILENLQRKEWSPLIKWFCERFQVSIEPTKDIMNSSIDGETRKAITAYLMSFNFPSVLGINFAVESLKSVILTLSCIDRRLSVDQAVLLSRLEEEYQTKYWGRVEWAHDVNQFDLQARVAAGILFAHLNSMSEQIHSKLKSL